jgi:hypothetical protein
MASSISRERDRARIEQELRGDSYRELLRRLQVESTFLRQYESWNQVVRWMRGAPAGHPNQDAVLGPLLQAHQHDHDPRWRTLLLALFWHGLDSIHRRRRRWDPNPEQRWQNLVWAFLQALSGLDVARRSDRFFEKLYAETTRRLYREYAGQWRDRGREIPTDPETLALLAGAADDADAEVCDLSSVRQAVIDCLRGHLAAGHIDEVDFLLLVGTRVYEKSVAEYCRETGMSYEAARRRRARAEALLRRHQKKSEKT